MLITAEALEQGLVLPLDKPYGWSSFDAVRYIQRGIRRHLGLSKIKIGHAGTLDPLATGALLICLGKATKQAQELQNSRKEYLAVLRLGGVTPSCDLETDPCCHQPFAHITKADAERVLPLLTGRVLQTPPIFSAKNIDGARAYHLARRGVDIALPPVPVDIYSIEITDFALPFVTLLVTCGKGTYIRALARDIGNVLGCGAYLARLRRTACGIYHEQTLCSVDGVFEGGDN